jgi:hypothetical protein
MLLWRETIINKGDINNPLFFKRSNALIMLHNENILRFILTLFNFIKFSIIFRTIFYSKLIFYYAYNLSWT